MKTVTKQIFAIVIISVALIAIAACGGSGNDANIASDDPVGDVPYANIGSGRGYN